MIDLATARARIHDAIEPGAAPLEQVELAQAHARVLAHAIVAPRDVPGFAHAAMDGYAVRSVDLVPGRNTRLRVTGRLLAGEATGTVIGEGVCMRIMTGAALPPGADSVVIREQATETDGIVELTAEATAGANVRHADDDWRAGTPALAAGRILDPSAVAVLASFGMSRVLVRRRPRIAVLVTGDELVAPGQVLRTGQRHDSNRILLAGLITLHAAEVGAAQTLPDDRSAIGAALEALSATHDLVITTGGASAGDSDWLPGLLAERGERSFWKVALRPGMPCAFGRIGTTPVFVLPGNPVSVFATFIALVRPALARWLGAAALDPPPLMARLSGSIDKRHSRREFRRAWCWLDARGVLHVAPHAALSSGALRSVVESNGLLELSEPSTTFQDGSVLPVHLLGPLEVRA